MDFRIGHGYDAHQLVEGRRLVLGGVKVPHTLGLLGHSDADVLLHAVMDAIIGALALGDIGCLFPDSDQTYKDADSLRLLGKVRLVMEEMGWQIGNIDATVVAQESGQRQRQGDDRGGDGIYRRGRRNLCARGLSA